MLIRISILIYPDNTTLLGAKNMGIYGEIKLDHLRREKALGKFFEALDRT